MANPFLDHDAWMHALLDQWVAATEVAITRQLLCIDRLAATGAAEDRAHEFLAELEAQAARAMADRQRFLDRRGYRRFQRQ